MELEFSAEYDNYIHQMWEDFQRGEKLEGKLRPDIYESWQRCRKLQVPTSSLSYEPLPPEKLNEILLEEAELIEIARPILNRIHQQVNFQENLLCLSNAHGIMLKVFQGQMTQGIFPGDRALEKNLGTSGMATCMCTKKAIVIYGNEHYCEPFRSYVCVASPIEGPDGQLIGGVSMSCKIKNFTPYIVPIVQEAAISIAEQMKLKNLLNIERLLLKSFGDGLILLDRNGMVLRINSKAREMLGLSQHFDITDCNINFFFSNFDKKQHITEGRAFHNEEVRIKSELGRTVKPGTFCVLNYTPSEYCGILTVRPAADMHAYAAKIMGSKTHYHFEDILGDSDAIKQCLSMAQKFSSEDYPVLLLGESGTGKELFAQSIHNASTRRNKPFIAVNCGALPRDLIQSELFGYVEGAFTGALRNGNPGKFELADGGTIFLDEIGEMPLDAQVNLLRLLQNGEVMRIGGKSVRHVNVRIIAATNKNLTEEVHLKRFRSDLYYRLNVFSLRIPPLRDRRTDIPLLANNFLRKITLSHSRFQNYRFGSDTVQWLMTLPWAGNVRELEHAVERAIYTASSDVIQMTDFGELAFSPIEEVTPNEKTLFALGDMRNGSTADEERKNIVLALQRTNGKVEDAAILLGTSRGTLYSRLNKYGINAKHFRKLQFKAQEIDNIFNAE